MKKKYQTKFISGGVWKTGYSQIAEDLYEVILKKKKKKEKSINSHVELGLFKVDNLNIFVIIISNSKDKVSKSFLFTNIDLMCRSTH